MPSSVNVQMVPVSSISKSNGLKIDLRNDFKKTFKNIPQTTRPKAMLHLIHVASSSKFVEIMALRPEMFPPQGHMFYIGLHRENIKEIFLPDTTRPRALISCKKHHLMISFKIVQIIARRLKIRVITRFGKK